MVLGLIASTLFFVAAVTTAGWTLAGISVMARGVSDFGGSDNATGGDTSPPGIAVMSGVLPGDTLPAATSGNGAEGSGCGSQIMASAGDGGMTGAGHCGMGHMKYGGSTDTQTIWGQGAGHP